MILGNRNAAVAGLDNPPEACESRVNYAVWYAERASVNPVHTPMLCEPSSLSPIQLFILLTIFLLDTLKAVRLI